MYPVEEIDLLEVLTTHAHEERDRVRQRYEETKKRFETLTDRPRGIDLPVTSEERTWVMKPEISDLTPLKGFERHWLFINGDDESQVALARRFMKDVTVATHRVILVSGSVLTTQKTLKTRVWFDQNARLVEKLGIHALPCVARLNENGILMKEVRP